MTSAPFLSQKPKIVASIEARMTSSRLPGKVLMTADGKPMLEILVERLQRAHCIDAIIVATTVNAQDNPIATLCERLGIPVFRGSEMNVLERVCSAAQKMSAEVLVEITGDCPLIDPTLVDAAIATFLERYPANRYVSNSGPNISIPWGFDVQVFMAADLYTINADNPDEQDREHVSYRFYRPESGDQYQPYFIRYTGELNRPELRVTLDYHEDYELIKSAYESLAPKNSLFGAVDIIRWLDSQPTIRDAAIACRENKQ